MPLVFVHGVANRPGPEQAAEIAQGDGLFRAIVFRNEATFICNPDWGSHAVSFTAGMPWLPNPEAVQVFAAGGANLADGPPRDVGLGRIATGDGAQAVDLAVLAVSEQSIADAVKQAGPVVDEEFLALARRAADYLGSHIADEPKGIAELAATNDNDFADALEAELASLETTDLQVFGIGDTLRNGVAALGGWMGNAVSDAVLRMKRRDLSRNVALFLGDIFVYLRNRETAGPNGTAARLFEPIMKDLLAAAKAPRADKEPFVVIGHSLGGVLLYDILTDASCLRRLNDSVPGFHIDCWLTVGSQPGLFADMKLYLDRAVNNAGRLDRPACVANWLNVYDLTDVFSFLCKPSFEGVDDYGYDTVVDLFHAHSAYFQRPSFYKRLELRLKGLGFL